MDQKALQIELTPEQRGQLQQATRIKVPSLDMTVEPLEERVAPKVAIQDLHFVATVNKAS